MGSIVTPMTSGRIFKRRAVAGISLAAEKMGFRTRGVQITFEQLIGDASAPVTLHWHQNHFVVARRFSLNPLLIFTNEKERRRQAELELGAAIPIEKQMNDITGIYLTHYCFSVSAYPSFPYQRS